MNEEDLKFYNMQDKEELVWMCISRDNRIKSLQQRINKAIEYINNQMYYYEDDGDCGVDCCCDGFKLLKILGGDVDDE